MRYSDLSQVDCVVHKALELYAFIAITGSRSTLESLIQMIKADNNFRQDIMDSQGKHLARRVDVCEPLVFTCILLTSLFSMEQRASPNPYTNWSPWSQIIF